MSTINRLSSVDVLQPSDQIPVWDSSNGDTRKASMSTLLAFVESYFADPDYSTRIVAPAVDYFTVDIGATGDSIWMIVNPTLNFTNGAITLPPASSAVNDQQITVVFTSSVSTFVITSSGATVLGAPTQINGYDSFSVRYNSAQQTWYNIGTTGSGSGSGVSQIVREDFTGDGTTTTFALSNIPSALGNELQIFIDGVYQERAGYTVSGVNIIFSEAPPSLSNIEVLGWAVSIGAETSSNLVSYTPAGTGAVLTTVQSKLRESVSVKDFGAVGDGVTNDYAAFNSALNSGAGSVFVPSATYVIGTNIVIPSGVSLVGEAGRIPKLLFSDGVTIGLMRRAQQDTAIIENIDLDLTNITNNCVGILFNGTWRSDIRKILMRGPGGTNPASGQVSYGIVYRSLYSAAYVNAPQAVALDALQTASSGSTYGVYYNNVQGFIINGFGYGILEVSAEDSGSRRVNQNLFLNGNTINNYYGVIMSGCGGGNNYINCSFESMTGAGIVVENQGSGTAPVIIGGEVSSSGDHLQGNLLAINVAGTTDPSANGAGEIGTHMRFVGAGPIFYGSKPRYENAIRDEFRGSATLAPASTYDVTTLRSELDANAIYQAVITTDGSAQGQVAYIYCNATASTVSLHVVTTIGSDSVWGTDGAKIYVENTSGAVSRTLNWSVRLICK